MKKSKLFIFLGFCYLNSFSQDLVVTNEGDSLNCKITKIKNEYIYFVFKHKDEIRSTLLPLTGVKIYQYNFFQNAIVPANKVVGNEIYPHWKFVLNGGWSYQTANFSDNVPSDFIDYEKKLKSGYHFGGDIDYYFSEPLGIGLKFLLFKTSNQLDNIYITYPDGSRRYGTMQDNISITFIGPTFSTRILNAAKKNSLILNLSIGYLGYYDNALVVDKYIQTGSTVGLVWDIGYDIGVSKNMAIGFQISLIEGTLYEYEINDGSTTRTIKLDKDNYIGLGRFDLSIGIRFSTNK